MDVRWEKSLRDQDHRNRHNPSFSSTLLDAIYRSIDEPAANHNNSNNNKRDHENMVFYKESMTRKKHFVEKKNASSEKVVFRRKSMEDLDKKVPVQHQRYLESVLLNSSSTSSDSSCGGGFSSSESESFSRPKPIRTSFSSTSTTRPEMMHKGVGFGNKTKSKALKIYGDLNKKVKQPISPGGRLASFLNSIFTAGNPKKAKIKSKSSDKASSLSSTCSSASSFSRSCLSNTPSSRGTNGVKRSVRFCPVSVIVDEECRPCGHKALYENKETSGGGGSGSSSVLMAVVKKSNSTINEELRLHIMNENHRVEEVARDLLKNYRKIDDSDDDEEEDDAASYSSSDLFELDNLSAIGIERYREELPVYETTHLDTNLAIANGLIM